MRAFEIELIAQSNGMETKTVIPSDFSEVEYLAVELKEFRTAFFIMDSNTFEYTYSHTYDAVTDKRTKYTPKIFKSTPASIAG